MNLEEKIKKTSEKMLKHKVITEDPIFAMSDSYGFDTEKDKLVDSINISDRLKAVSIGYGIEKLKDDASVQVRLAIVRSGYVFNSFIKDSSPLVRLELAKINPECVKDDVNSAVRREALKRIQDSSNDERSIIQNYCSDNLEVCLSEFESGSILASISDDEYEVLYKPGFVPESVGASSSNYVIVNYDDNDEVINFKEYSSLDEAAKEFHFDLVE